MVFALPEQTDKYGNANINAKIREYKNMSLSIASWSTDPRSLYDTVMSGSQSYIDEANSTYKNTEALVKIKIDQANQAKTSIENAYNAIDTAKKDLSKFTTLSGTTTP
jgi:hypothetical protein